MIGNDSYPHLFSPYHLAGMQLKNRIVHASISPHFGAEDGMHPGYLQYYLNRARGGAGMIVTDPIGIAPHHTSHRVCAWNDSMEGDLRRLAGAIEGEDCRLLGQVQDSGRGRHIPGRSYTAIGASPLPDDLSYTMPHVLSTSEVRAFIESAAQSAARMQRCGFSGVELSSGHGHMFHQFLSPRSNQREDDYGGDFDGRARLVVETCAAIRAACGSGFIIGVKLPGNDGIADSVTPELAARIAAHLVSKVAVDYLCFAQGTHHRTLEMHIPDDSSPRMTYMGLVGELRKTIPGVPVMALGRITDPAEAEGIIASGQAELVALGRALITDPAWPNKARQGRARDIRYCVSCNTCWKVIIAHNPIVCDNNPRVAQADELDALPPPAAQKKRVAVVGAGIAGLEAAWNAAARGHDVTVFGSSAEVGGKTRLQASLPHSESLSSIYDYQFVAAQKAGARFELGITASADRIISFAPDSVVLATGATMTWPACLPASLKAEGIVPDLREAMQELLGRKERQRGTAVILDMDQMDGTYVAAESLRDIFDRVVLLTARERIAEETALTSRQRILRRFHERGIEFICLVEPRWSDRFENEGRLEYGSVFGGPSSFIDDVAFFAYSTPRAPNDALVAPLRAAGIEVHRIGDCKIARDVLAATTEGSAIGRAL